MPRRDRPVKNERREAIFMNELIFTGMKRRKKEFLNIFLVTLIVTFFMSGILMFQNILKAYILEKNRDSYGDWVFASDSPKISHGYLTEKGSLSAAGPLTDEEGKANGVWIGSISPELFSFGRISLYEGHMPENENEVAADLRTLQKLGRSYELGQEITFYWNAAERGEEPDIREKTCILSGTVKAFSAFWLQDGWIHYPNLIVTEEVLADLGKETHDTWFYRLDPSLTDPDTDSLYESMLKKAQEDNARLSYNNYVYSGILWGNGGGKLVVMMTLLLAVCAISFVLSSYADRRRAAYYRFRKLGTSRAELKGIILKECGISTVPPALLGIMLAYFLGFLGCMLAAKAVGLHGFFAFELPVFLLQMAAAFGSILLSILVIFFRTGDRQLARESRTISADGLRKLRSRLPRLKKPEKEFFLRPRILSGRSGAAATFFTILVTAFLVVCGSRIYRAINSYISTSREEDYRLSFQVMKTVVDNHYEAEDGTLLKDADGNIMHPKGTLTVHDPYHGPDEADLQYLNSIAGIERIEGACLDSWHDASWKGMNEWPGFGRSSYGIDGVEYREVITKTNVTLFAVSDEGYFLEIMKDCGVSMDKEKLDSVMQGRLAVLLYEGTFFDPSEAGFPEVSAPAPIREGEMIRIFGSAGKGVSLPVLPLEDRLPILKYASTLPRGQITLFVSPEITETLRQMEEPVPEFRNNYYRIWFNSFASFEATDKILTSYAASNPDTFFFNNAEYKRHSLQVGTLQPLFIFGSLFFMTLSIYLILSRNLIGIRAAKNAEMIRRIRKLGMPKRDLRRLLLQSELVEALPVFTGLLAGLSFRFILVYLSERKTLLTAEAESILLHNWTNNALLISLEDLMFRSGILWLLLMTIVLYLAMTYFGYRRSLDILHEEEVIL